MQNHGRSVAKTLSSNVLHRWPSASLAKLPADYQFGPDKAARAGKPKPSLSSGTWLGDGGGSSRCIRSLRKRELQLVHAFNR